MRIRFERGLCINPDTIVRAQIVPEDPRLVNRKPSVHEWGRFRLAGNDQSSRIGEKSKLLKGKTTFS